jgi:dephospho-CoA kinase
MISRIALSGKMGSGKSFLCKELMKNHDFQIVSISEPIKHLSSLLINQKPLHEIIAFSEDVVQFSINTTYKDFFTELMQQEYKNVAWVRSESGDLIKTESYRKFTQDVARFFREHTDDPNVWLKHSIRNMIKMNQEGKSVVCDDLRLRSEKKLFEDNHFAILRLDISSDIQKERLSSLYGNLEPQRLQDITEVDLDQALFDLRIDNSYLTSQELFTKVSQFLKAA